MLVLINIPLWGKAVIPCGLFVAGRPQIHEIVSIRHFDRMSTDLHRLDSVGTDHCPVQSPDTPEDAGHSAGTSKLSGQARRRPAGQSVHLAGLVPGLVPAGRPERSRTLLRPAEREEWVFCGSMLHIDHRIQSVVARASSWCQAFLLAAGHFHGRTRCRHCVGSVMLDWFRGAR